MGHTRTESFSKLRMQKEMQKKTFSGELSCPETFPGTEPPRTWRLLGHTAPWGIHSKPPGRTHPPLWAVLADNTDGSESSRVNEKSGTGRAQLRCSSSHGTPSTRPAPMTFLFLPGTRRGRNSSDHLVTSPWKHCVPLIGSMSTAVHTGVAIPMDYVALFLVRSQTHS